MMKLQAYRKDMLPRVEEELKAVVQMAGGEGLGEMQHMLSYHLGWEGEGAGPQANGKRVRPLLVLLTSAAAGGYWQEALPAAAAVELVHNFSLIHDDIQDESATRRGRPTLWAKWGVAQAINAGDAMFALAHIALQRLEERHSAQIYAQAARLLPQTSLHLTQGQYMDLAYEGAEGLNLDDYWPMVRGKTAVLFATCARLGALSGGAGTQQMETFARFGEKLGLAFQVHDDLLGTWGVEQHIGKSTQSDLVSGKKSLPILYALGRSEAFAKRWNGGKLKAGEVGELVRLLEETGAKEYAQEQAARLTEEALAALQEANPLEAAGEALRELALELVRREK